MILNSFQAVSRLFPGSPKVPHPGQSDLWNFISEFSPGLTGLADFCSKHMYRPPASSLITHLLLTHPLGCERSHLGLRYHLALPKYLYTPPACTSGHKPPTSWLGGVWIFMSQFYFSFSYKYQRYQWRLLVEGRNHCFTKFREKPNEQADFKSARFQKSEIASNANLMEWPRHSFMNAIFFLYHMYTVCFNPP